MNKHLNQYLIVMVTEALKSILFIVNMSILVRLLHPDGVGIRSIIVATAAFFHSVILHWYGPSNTRFGKEEWELNKNLNRTLSARMTLVLISFIVITLFLIFQPFNLLCKLTKVNASWWPLVLLNIMSLWFQSELQSILQIKEKMISFSIFSLISQSILTLLYLFFMYVSPSTSILTIITTISIITTILWGGYWIKELFAVNYKPCFPDVKYIYKILNYSWPLIPGVLVGFVSNWGDHFIIQNYLTIEDVGYFQLAYQAMLFLMNLAAPLYLIIFPKLVGKKLTDSTIVNSYVSSIIPTVSILWLLFIFPICIFFPYFFKLIIGTKYLHSILILPVLFMTIPGAIIPNLYSLLFLVQGRVATQTAIYVATAITNVAISFILIPKVGLYGAAFGTIVSNFISHIFILVNQHNYLKIKKRKMLLVVFIFILFSVGQLFAGLSVLNRSIYFVIFMVIFMITIRIFKIVNKNTVQILFSGKLNFIGYLIEKTLIKT